MVNSSLWKGLKQDTTVTVSVGQSSKLQMTCLRMLNISSQLVMDHLFGVESWTVTRCM